MLLSYKEDVTYEQIKGFLGEIALQNTSILKKHLLTEEMSLEQMTTILNQFGWYQIDEAAMPLYPERELDRKFGPSFLKRVIQNGNIIKNRRDTSDYFRPSFIVVINDTMDDICHAQLYSDALSDFIYHSRATFVHIDAQTNGKMALPLIK